MEITKEYKEKEVKINIDGRIDTYTSPDLENAINDELNKYESIKLNFENVEYISSAGLRVLIVTQKQAIKDGFEFTICNVNETVNKIFQMSKLDKILNIQ